MSTTQLKGNVTIASDAGTTTTIGNLTGATIINATNIKQNIKVLNGNTIQNVVGDTDNVSSLSTNFNQKTFTATNANFYTIATGGVTYDCQYFELVASGGSNNLGGFMAKWVFGIATNVTVAIQGQATLYNYTNFSFPSLALTLTVSGSNVTVNITAPKNGGTLVTNLVTTLTAYPTVSLNGPLTDYSITAI
jgi:hypothetical protein